MCIFAVSVACTEKVSWAPTHAGVFIPQVFWTSTYISATQSLHGAHMRSCTHSLFIVVWGRWLRGSTSLYGALVAWPGELFWAEGEMEVLSCVFCILDAAAGGSVLWCKCVCSKLGRQRFRTVYWVLRHCNYSGAQHPLSPEINLGVRNSRKKERKQIYLKAHC